jgi:hypothetical protein
VGANATAANDDDEGVAEFGEAFVGKEDAVSCELFENQCFVVVSEACAAGKGNASFVFFAVRRVVYHGATEVVDLILTLVYVPCRNLRTITFSTSCFEDKSGMEPFKSCMLYHLFAFCRPITAVAAIHPDASAVTASCSRCDSGSHEDMAMDRRQRPSILIAGCK